MQKPDLNVPNSPLKPFPIGMAIGALADIAIKLIISGYILAVVVYVNATGNWDKDDDLGTSLTRTVTSGFVSSSIVNNY